MSSRFSSGRTAKGFALILGAARAAGLRGRPSGGNVTVRKAAGDELVILAMNDPVMATAIHGARKTLGKFLALAKNPGPTMGGSSVKIAIPVLNGAEFSSIRARRRSIYRANQQHAALGGEPEDGRHCQLRQNEIIDWMYMDAGKMRGNYSAHAILKSARPEDREAFKRRFGLDYL